MILSRLFLVALLSYLIAVPGLQADDAIKTPELPAVFSKAMPENLDDLKAIEDHLEKVVEKVMPAVVSIRIGNAAGSGVIVTKDGYVLTAGHVSGRPGQQVTIIFHDGKKVPGVTLGGNHGIDSGMMKITAEGEYPFMEMGDSSALKVGQWCFVCSHPGGFRVGRTPPVRLGRLLKVGTSTLVSDCILVGGDSGGPLFDMHGKVIGINSRINTNISINMHVPVDPYRESWERMAKNEVWGGRLGSAPVSGTYLGINFDPAAQGCVVQQVAAGSPAEKAGLQAKDEILKFAGKEVASGLALAGLVRATRAGTEVVLEVRRGEEVLILNATIGKR